MRRFSFWAIASTRFLSAAQKPLRIATALLLCLVLSGWSLPAFAASRISPRLEEQVLQILREHPEAILESVQAYQQQQQQQLSQAQQAFLQQLKTNPQTVIGESATTGAPESKVVLVEFSDFQCPYCAQAHKTLKQFVANHQDEVKLVFKHYPLAAIHAQALPAAKAAWAAGKQGKFWEFHDELFTQQDKLGEELYVAIAQNLTLDLEQFNSDRASDAANAAIGQDIQLATALGIEGTPFFVMNGEAFTGAIGLADMEKILARAEKS